MDGVEQMGIGQDRSATNVFAVYADSRHSAIFNMDFFHHAMGANIDAVFYQFLLHFFDELVGAALKGVHPFVHEVGKYDAIRQRRVVQGGAIGVGDGFHQKAPDIFSSRKKFLEQLAGGHLDVIVKIHIPGGDEKFIDNFLHDAKAFPQNAGKIRTVKGGAKGKLGVIEADTPLRRMTESAMS